MGQHKSKMPPELIIELLEKTKFNKDELKVLYKEYSKFKTSGGLSIEGFQHLHGDYGTPEFTKIVFNTFDKSGDGRLDFKEYATAMSISRKGTIEQRLMLTFKLYDENNSGFITEEEMVKVMKALPRRKDSTWDGSQTAEQRAKDAFHRMDINKDGRLSQTEFINGVVCDQKLSQLCN